MIFWNVQILHIPDSKVKEKKMEKKRFMSFESCNPNNIRAVADRLSKKYTDLDRRHVFWVAKAVGIYPDGVSVKNKKQVSENCCGKINRESKYVTKGKMNEDGVKAIESYITAEGYEVKKDWKEDEKPIAWQPLPEPWRGE